MLQHDQPAQDHRKEPLSSTIKSELTKMLRNDRERVRAVLEGCSVLQIKFGVYDNLRQQTRTLLEDLLMFTSSHENKLTTLDEYVSRMKEEQKYIYYASRRQR